METWLGPGNLPRLETKFAGNKIEKDSFSEVHTVQGKRTIISTLRHQFMRPEENMKNINSQIDGVEKKVAFHAGYFSN